MNFFEFQANQNQKVHQAEVSTPEETEKKKEISKNLRLVILAIHLQCLVKKLPSSMRPATRITLSGLAENYQDMKASHTIEASLKMARRDLQYMDDIFGLEGSYTSGFAMHRRFESFHEMFKFWLDSLGKPKPLNRRMHVLINGLIHAIDNGFRDDPIIIPDLAREFKEQYKNKNIRDSKDPLIELFSNSMIASYLVLLGEDDNMFHINKSADPLLMRLKSRHEIGDNIDISINLALPGRVRLILDDHISHLESNTAEMVRNIALSVCESHTWADEFGNQVVPYILYREGENGPLILTLWQANDGNYRDIPIDEISSIPESNQSRFLPYNMPAKLWEQFRQITA